MTEPPRDPSQTLMKSQGKTAFMQALGVTEAAAAPGKAMLYLPYAPHIVGNPDTGVVHGGAITGLLDHACGAAVGSALAETITDPAQRLVTSYATLDLRIDYLKAATPGVEIVVTGECVKITRQIVFARGVAYQDNESDPIATAVAAFIMTVQRRGG